MTLWSLGFVRIIWAFNWTDPLVVYKPSEIRSNLIALFTTYLPKVCGENIYNHLRNTNCIVCLCWLFCEDSWWCLILNWRSQAFFILHLFGYLKIFRKVMAKERYISCDQNLIDCWFQIWFPWLNECCLEKCNFPSDVP